MRTKPILLGSGVLITLVAAGCCTSGGGHASRTKHHPPTSYSGSPAISEQQAQPQTTSLQEGQLEIVNDQTEIPLRKEEVVVNKRAINEKVVVRTVVKTDEVSHPVDLRREDYVVERIPANGTAQATTENAFQAREVFMPLLREEVVSGKRTILTDTIRITKKTETDNKTINRALRSEDVEVVANPDLSDPKFKDVPRQAATGAPPAAETATSPAPESDPNTFRLAKEELVVGKKANEGGVYLKKIVRTQESSQPVELRREEAVIERTTPQPSVVVNDIDFGTPREVTLEVSREEAVPEVRTVLAETVRLKKKSESGQQTVSGTVRKQDIEVIRSQDSAQGTPATTQTETQKKDNQNEDPDKK